MQFAYDDFGQLVTEYQEHGGAVNTGTSLKVQYTYEDSGSTPDIGRIDHEPN